MASQKQKCPGCAKSLANLDEALKAHAWSKSACRPCIPAEMLKEIEDEERGLAARPDNHRCPGCGKRIANLDAALKAHAWSKSACRPHIPEGMLEDIEKEERALTAKPEAHRCPGCRKRIANLDEALKAHAWAKSACRPSVPHWMACLIEEEQRNCSESWTWAD